MEKDPEINWESDRHDRQKDYLKMDCRQCAKLRLGEVHWTKVFRTTQTNYNLLMKQSNNSEKNIRIEFANTCRHYRHANTSFFRFVYQTAFTCFTKKRSHDITVSQTYHRPLARSPRRSIFRRLSTFRLTKRPVLDQNSTNTHISSSTSHHRYLLKSNRRTMSDSTYVRVPDIILSQPEPAHKLPDYLIDISMQFPSGSLTQSESQDSGVEMSSVPRLSFCSQEYFPRLRCKLNTSNSSHIALTVTTSCPSWSGNKKVSTALSRCRSWPLLCRQNVELDETGDDAVFHEMVQFRKRLLTGESRSKNRASIGDCTIQYNDIEFLQCVRVGRRTSTHRGRWHGDVAIHVYNNLTKSEVSDFLDLVAKLSIIRHENIALFMGASIESPYCIITSVPGGTSLYDDLHLFAEKLPINKKFNIIKQVALGMGYLHARGIVLRKLNSCNIYQESKVRICLIDNGMAEAKHDRLDRACLRRGQLTYIAPEILTKLKVVPPRFMAEKLEYTKETDIYAFGTVIYEILTGLFPSLSSSTHCQIWQICSGRRRSVSELRCVASVKNLIAECWSHDAKSRPQFHEINKQLGSTALRKRHSSDPELANASNYGVGPFVYNIK